VKFGPRANKATVSSETMRVLQDILQKSGQSGATITSIVRTPTDQARIMYSQLEDGTISKYGPAGQKVIAVYYQDKAADKSADEIMSDMEAEINALGPYNVSHHIGDPSQLNVVDIDPNSIADKTAFINAINDAKNARLISNFLQPPRDPAYHIEIPQPVKLPPKNEAPGCP
jgi:hypothetical protein